MRITVICAVLLFPICYFPVSLMWISFTIPYVNNYFIDNLACYAIEDSSLLVAGSFKYDQLIY